MRIQLYNNQFLLISASNSLFRNNSKMDDQFTSNADAVYLASLTQSKKIMFLERQLSNSETYAKNLQQDVQSLKLTLNRLIKERTNHEIIAKISENLYRIERRCKEMQQSLKQSNAKLLIQMQLRIQQKAQYFEKVRDLEAEIQLIRKTNKDKQQQFTIIVNKLRKYEDIRQLTLQDKITKQNKKALTIKQDDKDNIIKQLSEELSYYKKNNLHQKAEIDKKISILAFALQNQKNYASMKQQFIADSQNASKIYEKERVKLQKISGNSKNKNSQQKKDKKNVYSQNMNQNTKELIKQIKKLVISNRLLQTALNQSIQKNQQLIINNQILLDSNIEMKQKLSQYKRKQFSIIHKKINSHKQIQVLKKNTKRTQTLNLLKPTSEPFLFRESQDDSCMLMSQDVSVEQMIRQKKLKQYLDSLKSKDYQININQLNKDVHRMSEFLVLSLGKRQQLTKTNQKIAYTSIMQRGIQKRDSKSFSATARQSQAFKSKSIRKSSEQPPAQQINVTKQGKNNFLSVSKQYNINTPKTNEVSFKIEQY